jgi:hypothetical protein
MTRLLVMLVALASAQILAAPTKSVPVVEPRQIADDAMKYVAADDMKGLFVFVAKHMPLDRAALDKMRDGTIDQRKKLPAALGKSLGSAFIRECRVSDILVRLLYVEKREKNVLRWQFIFYRARNVWTMSHILWDDNVPSLFETCS